MAGYLKQYAESTRSTPQREQIPGRTDQVENSEGGFVWAVDCWTRLQRFLILGSEGGSYYATEAQLTKENAGAVLECIDEDGPRTVSVIVDISKSGRAPKNDPAIFALAMAASVQDVNTRRAALAALPEVCRIGTHLFTFMEIVGNFRGRGRALHRALQDWYEEKNPDALAYQIIKYRQRNNWTHRDILRIAKPKGETPVHELLYNWVAKEPNKTQGDLENTILNPAMPTIIEGYERAQMAKSPADTARAVREYNLPREALQTEHLNDPEVWRAMLDMGMPMTAMIRNLATMTRNGVIEPMGGSYTQMIVEQITDPAALVKARVHPLTILVAMKTYQGGRSIRGANTWTANSKIVNALDAAFYSAFGNVEPSNKRTMLAIDVSASMTWSEIAGMPGITPHIGAGAMAMVTERVEPACLVTAFSSSWGGDGITPVDISSARRLDDVIYSINSIGGGGTDCALPMLWAADNNVDVDTFIIYTDNETWAGTPHPSQALEQYRQKSGLPSKLVTVGMISNGFTIADPQDPGMLDVVGFDTATPNIMSSFSAGAF